jgi:hypothetical protein
MGTVTVLTAERMLEIEAESVHASSVVVNKTVAAVPAATGVTSTVLLGKAFRLDRVVSNKACRLRLYISSAHRTADADRPRDQDPIGDHGLIAEIVLTPSILDLTLLPMPHGYCVSGTTYLAVFNDDTTGDINLTFTEHVLEP